MMPKQLSVTSTNKLLVEMISGLSSYKERNTSSNFEKRTYWEGFNLNAPCPNRD